MTDDPLDSPQDSLLDLPLRGASETSPGHEEGASNQALPWSSATRGDQQDLFTEDDAAVGPRAVPPAEGELDATSLRTRRLKAGLLDLSAHLVVLALLVLGVHILGIRIDRSVLVPLAATVVAFSFLYTVPSLMIWGRTPGMAINGLLSESAGGRPVAAGQALRRWLAGWLTWLTAGLAGLFEVTDRLSGTRTRRAETNDQDVVA